MSRGKGFPYKEKKKPKTAVKQDRRPHSVIETPYDILTKREVERYDISFAFPNNRGYAEHPVKWTKDEIHTIIDNWATISWRTSSQKHRQMQDMAGHVGVIYDRQKGYCPITGIPLFGGPGLCECGIAIDIINRPVGIRRGNLRLTSIPFALARQGLIEIDAEYAKTYGRPLSPVDFIYEDRLADIEYIIFKAIQTVFIKLDPFKHHPVVVHFRRQEAKDKKKRTPNKLICGGVLTNSGKLRTDSLTDPLRTNADVAFYYFTAVPSPGKTRESGHYKFIGKKKCMLIDKHAYERVDIEPHEFCTVTLTGDVLNLKCAPSSHYAALRRYVRGTGEFIRTIHLADPNINLEKAIVTFAKQAYDYTVRRHYYLLAQDRGLACNLKLPLPPTNSRIQMDGF